MASATNFTHVDLDAQGVPHISGSTMKVAELVMAQSAHGWSPEELRFQYPHLTLAQIYAALAYYWDHKTEVDADIERRGRFVETVRAQAGQSALADKIKRRP